MGSHRVGHDWSNLAAAVLLFGPPIAYVAISNSWQSACRKVSVTEWTDGETDKHKGQWQSPGPKESKTWAPCSPYCGEIRRFWKGCGIHVSKQTLPQIASVISLSPDIQTAAGKKRRTESPSNGIHWQDWFAWLIFDKWDSKSVRCWTRLLSCTCMSILSLGISLPFPSSISFTSFISFYPFSLFLLRERVCTKNSNFSCLRQKKRKGNLYVHYPPELLIARKKRENFQAGELLLVADVAWNCEKGGCGWEKGALRSRAVKSSVSWGLHWPPESTCGSRQPPDEGTLPCPISTVPFTLSPFCQTWPLARPKPEPF